MLRAAAANPSLGRSLLISPAGPRSPAVRLLQFSRIPHPPGAALPCPSRRGMFTQTGALQFPGRRQSHPAAPRVAPCASSHRWHLGQRHWNSPGVRGSATGRVQHLGHLRRGPGSGAGKPSRVPRPRGWCYARFLFRCKDTAFLPGAASVQGATAAFTPPFPRLGPRWTRESQRRE